MGESIIGQRIVQVRKMTQAECNKQGYPDRVSRNLAAVLVLENGVQLWAQRDDEGNGLGTLVGHDPKGAKGKRDFYVQGV